MADDTENTEEEAPKKGSKLPLIGGIVGALLLGGGGFYAVYSGLFDPMALFGGGKEETAHAAPAHDTGHGETDHADSGHGAESGHGGEENVADIGSITFVPLEDILVSLPKEAASSHLRFSSQLEVVPGQASAVKSVMPRILDALNTYLRAVDVKDIEDPSASARLRAQMLRRVQVVTGEGMVKDLLITEFVLN